MAEIQVLDLGCGTFPYKAAENEHVTHVDCRSIVCPDVVHDLSQFPYPFEDNSFDKIYASHVLEHLPGNIRFMEEIYRIGRSDGIAIIRVPHFSGRSAWCDPTHLRAYSYYQFYYYNPKSRDWYGNCNFEVQQVRLNWIRFPQDRPLVARAMNRLINPDISPNLNIFDEQNGLTVCSTRSYDVF